MKQYLKRNSKIYNEYLNYSEILGKSNQLEYLFSPQDDKRKKDYDYYEYLKELNEETNIINKNIKNFLDICAAPGLYSSYIYDITKASGIGISLPPSKGGLLFTQKISDYKLKYDDITKNINLDQQFDFIITGCLDMTLSKKQPYKDIELWISALIIALKYQQINGNLAFKITTKYLNFISNILFILKQCFEKVTIFKSENILGYRSMCYIVCKNRNDNNYYIKVLSKIRDKYQLGDFKYIEKLKHQLIFNINEYGEFIKQQIEKSLLKQINSIKTILNEHNII